METRKSYQYTKGDTKGAGKSNPKISCCTFPNIEIKPAEDYCKMKGIACSEDERWLKSGKLDSTVV